MADVGDHAADDYLGTRFPSSFGMHSPGRPVTPGWVKAGRGQEALRAPCVVS